MRSAIRLLLRFALGAVLATAGAAIGHAADDIVLPAEPTVGEWLEDTLTDDSLWFAASDNVGFEALATELTEYPRGRRWVRVVDGCPAWVMYYVPGEILGFEVDTHHLGARAVDFRFAAGSGWNALVPVAADYEEIAAYEAKWMRLYRAADHLPAGACFLRIDFPDGVESDAARLTEVWLRCRFEAPHVAAPLESAAAPAPKIDTVATIVTPVESEPTIEPYVVTTLVYRPTLPAGPENPRVAGDATLPVVEIRIPPRVTRYELLEDVGVFVETPPPGAVASPATMLSRIASFLHLRGSRSR